MRSLRDGSATTAGVTAGVVVLALTSRCGPGAAPEPSAAQAAKADEDQDMADDRFLARENPDAMAQALRNLVGYRPPAGTFFGEVRGAGLPPDAAAEGRRRHVKTLAGATDSLDEALVG